MDSIDTLVVGAGVIGLSVARELARRGHDVLIVEALEDFGTEISARNSEVIHAGIYYPQNSLKARLCVSGRKSLYEFCERYDVQHRRCGKLIVATSAAQLQELKKIKIAAAANGVALAMLDREQALTLEPQLECVGALHSPETGIIDSHGYMFTLLAQAEEAGATIAYRSRVTSGRLQDSGVCVAINDQREPSMRARLLVNCAGLYASQLMDSLQGFPAEHVPRTHFAKGNYFTLRKRSPFNRLVYPIPEAAGLGVHCTLDLAGRARFGPDVEWVDEVSYRVDPQRAENFYASIRNYWPGLQAGDLDPGYAGVRPKIVARGEAAADFRIDGPKQHGVSSVINLFGIESPGLTASLAIAEEVALLL